MSFASETICVQGDTSERNPFGAVSVPIYASATFEHPALGESTGYAYSRVQNPTRDALQRTVALLEEGEECLAFASGMAAITAVMELFFPGDHILATDGVYGGTFRLWNAVSKKHGVTVECIDTSDLEKVKASFRPETKAVFLESPSNPTMKVSDIAAIADIAREHHCLVLVDNTFLSPYFQKPLTLGADVVIHSGTKYLGGHNDVLSGFVITPAGDIAERLKYIYKTTGSGLSPMDSWLVLRGMKTLALRMEQHQKNALAIAHWLKTQKKVQEVFYIGLEDRKDRELILRQCTGFGGMISFRVDSFETVKQVLSAVKLIRFAESLGGVETLITFPMSQTHAEVPEEIREGLGITDTLLRLSVGIENADDLIADLDQALNGK